LRKIVSSF